MSKQVEFNGIIFRKVGPYYRPNGTECQKGTESLHRETWKFYNGDIPEKHHIHHKDGDTDNNDISNLECLLGSTHLSEHASQPNAWCNTEKGKEHFTHIRSLAVNWHKSEEGRAWHKEHARKVATKVFAVKDVTKVCLICSKTYHVHAAVASRSKFCHPNCRQQAIRNRKKTSNP